MHINREGTQSSHVIHLVHGILRRALDFWKISVPLRCDQVHTCTQAGERPKGWVVKKSELIKTLRCVRVHARNAHKFIKENDLKNGHLEEREICEDNVSPFDA